MSDRRRPMSVMLTCEHGGNSIPTAYRSLFTTPAAQQALDSHRGWDTGSLGIGRCFAKVFDVPLQASQVSRLLIELNRSLGHPKLFSDWSKVLAVPERERVIDEYYHPYRNQVITAVEKHLSAGNRVLHLSMHTFTPVWDGVRRSTDVGLLFDPQRNLEADVCAAWQRELRRALPNLRTHRNRPYRGTSDGLTTSLRRRFAPSDYLGIELEVNQRFFLEPPIDRTLTRLIAQSLKSTLT